MGGRRIAAAEQYAQLVSFQGMDAARPRLRPPTKTSLREPLLAQPEPLAVINKDFDGRRPTVAKYKDNPLKRVVPKLFLADPCQPVNAIAEIRRLDRDQNPHVRRQLNHGWSFHRARLKAARSGN